MKTVELLRLEMNKEHGTFGVLLIDDEFFCLTLELPDRGNQKNISSIPEGKYLCVPYLSKKYANSYKVVDVPGRTGILFHAGNTVKDTKGCILLGSKLGFTKGYKAILYSRKSVKIFLSLMNKEEFKLVIKEIY